MNHVLVPKEADPDRLRTGRNIHDEEPSVSIAEGDARLPLKLKGKQKGQNETPQTKTSRHR